MSEFFYGYVLFRSLNQQCQITEGILRQ